MIDFYDEFISAIEASASIESFIPFLIMQINAFENKQTNNQEGANDENE